MEKHEILILAAVGVVAYVLTRKPAASAPAAGLPANPAGAGTSGGTSGGGGGGSGGDLGPIAVPVPEHDQTSWEEANWPYSYLKPRNTDNPLGDPITGYLK
ncbi:hypothetical protein [Simplicispira suum]|uniref:Uncharacterized protein n=1 Tax=Simplicispira suum TaxID=2109915 RepID=A0A2S0N3L2_9BURK|nr:hypothetical protein [Simplicispira suum]AVO42725.1 hypothetical protein C6571_16765 [Simplicispira suum]